MSKAAPISKNGSQAGSGMLAAFFRLIRWPNLVFIALTQGLFYYCILLPSFQSGLPLRENILAPRFLALLSFSSVLIAAAGYIINDYFDVDIDRVNKPGKAVIDKVIRRRSAILWHWVLSGLGILIGAYLSWKIRNLFVVLSNIACVLLLWFYSTTFKKKTAGRKYPHFISHCLGNSCSLSLRIPASPFCRSKLSRGAVAHL